jgi:hypothetical protein
MRLRKRNTAWLLILAALLGIVLLSGAATVEVAAALIALYAVALLASIIEIQPSQLIDRSRSSLTSMRMSSDAREAVERARRRGSLTNPDLTLLDIGLITTHSGREGMVMRRTRSVSLDDDGVRPFITLHVQPESADRHALIRYEIIDQNGDTQYVHEMRTFLRDGEMNILADHHLRLYDNERSLGAGDWDLRVMIDGALVAAYSFTMAPSVEERARPRRPDASASRDRLVQALDDDTPMKLEDLLRPSEAQRRGQSSR